MVKLLLISAISGFVIAAILPKAGYPTEQYIEGYTRAAVDIKIFVNGTGQLPSEEWAKRAANYRLNKTATGNEGISLGLLPDPKTTLQPFAVSENK